MWRILIFNLLGVVAIADGQKNYYFITNLNVLFCDDISSVPISYGLDYMLDIQPIFNFYGCSDCHNGDEGGLNLSLNNGPPLLSLLSYSSDANGRTLIDPFYPEGSYLFSKINCDEPQNGLRMPFGGSTLSLEDQALIFDWISQGAYGEFPTGLWYREIIHRNNFEGTR